VAHLVGLFERFPSARVIKLFTTVSYDFS
jgi:hypothetical protein